MGWYTFVVLVLLDPFLARRTMMREEGMEEPALLWLTAKNWYFDPGFKLPTVARGMEVL